MLNLKVGYFYFLAIKINLTKLGKKIYFTSSFYNKSLNTLIPKQFYFFPNPFLLSSITSYKNFSFKIKDIKLENFWENISSDFEIKKLNSFFWLNLIDRKNDGLIIQKIISLWIDKNEKYKVSTWENSLISKRIISWILNADIIFNNTNSYFKENFLKSIIIQTNHLKKNIKFEKNYSKRIEILTAILLSGLVFKEYVENFNFSVKELENLTKEFFDTDGFPLSRNPNHLLKFSKYFILIKECTKDAQEYVPNFLDKIIEQNLNCIKCLLAPDSKIPLFNGGTEVNLKEYLKYTDKLNYKSKKIKNVAGGLSILKFKKDVIFFDVGPPPKKSFSTSYQSGPLSFEYYVDGNKIITNCGFGYNISKKAMLLSRLTSAQSTMTLNDTSVVKFERSKVMNKAFGNSIKSSFKVFDFNFTDNDTEIYASISHSAYKQKVGFIHKRKIKIDKHTSNLIGQDELLSAGNKEIAKYDIRFHLYPGLQAVHTLGGNSVLIQVSRNKSLIFSTKNQKISIEKSIFLGRNKILNNLCITLSGNLSDGDKIINWEIKKKLTDASKN